MGEEDVELMTALCLSEEPAPPSLVLICTNDEGTAVELAVTGVRHTVLCEANCGTNCWQA